jgi:uncharacterized protein
VEQRGFYFSTKNGNTYFYNDIEGNVSFYGNEPSDKFVFGKSKLNINDNPINETELANYLKMNSGNQLILLLTEACNIRCKYCVYSGNYDNQRIHGETHMDISTAKRAVDKYLEHYKERKNSNLFDNPIIGFYGGESFMNYRLIEEVVNYTKEISENPIMFSTTTNATLLNDKRIHFLAENKFILSISLNGDKDENDRLRVFANNQGTYDIILKNLNRIRELYPDYYKRYCQLLITIDTGTDLHRMRAFFKENKNILPKIARISQVGGAFTDWYDQYSLEEKEKFLSSLDELREIYKEQMLSGNVEKEEFLSILFNAPIFGILNRFRNVSLENRRPPFLSYTGACVPGDKIAVNSKGQLHVCERVNQTAPIGDIDTWLSVPLISNMLKEYRDKVMDNCVNCPIQSNCELCYPGVLGGDGKFNKKNMSPNCQEMRISVQTDFRRIWEMVEDGVGFEQLIPNL